MKNPRFKSILIVLLSVLVISCELIFDTKHFDYSEYDALFTTEESGRIKWQFTLGSSEDKTINTGIEYIYDKNKNLIEKQYRHFYDNKPTSYDIKEFFFYNNEGKLSKMERHNAKGTDDSVFLLDKYSWYNYPEQGIKVETKFDDKGILKDSIIYEYDEKLLVSEKHFNHDGYWEMNYTFNKMGKPETTFDSFTNQSYKYIYDETGLLKRIEDWADGEIRTILYYERKVRSDKLIIKGYRDKSNINKYQFQNTYINGKFYEHINYHPTMSGQWWCYRYEYFD